MVGAIVALGGIDRVFLLSYTLLLPPPPPLFQTPLRRKNPPILSMVTMREDEDRAWWVKWAGELALDLKISQKTAYRQVEVQEEKGA